MPSSIASPSSPQDEWSHKIAELLRSMPEELRDPTAVRAVLLGAVREMNLPAPGTATAASIPPVTPSASNAQAFTAPAVSPAIPAAPIVPAAFGTPAPGESLGIAGPAHPDWVSDLRQQPKVASLKKVGTALNQPLSMARHLMETGEFDTQAFRAAYGNGWTPSNREFGRQFADEIARCTAQQIAEGTAWTRATHHALVGLTALSASVLTHGVNALMSRLVNRPGQSEAVSQSMAITLQGVLNDLPSGHPAFHGESAMIVRAQLLETLATRQAMEEAQDLTAVATVNNPLRHLRRPAH